MALPPLEGDLILNDRFSDPIAQLTAGAARANQSLGGTQREMQKLANYMSFFGAELKGNAFFDKSSGSQLGISEILKKLPAGVGAGASSLDEIAAAYAATTDTTQKLTEATLEYNKALEGIGSADLSSFNARLDGIRQKTEDMAERERTLAASKPKKSDKLLDQEVDFAGMARQGAAAIPGFSVTEGAMLAKIFEILPGITVRTTLFAGALGLMGGAAIGAVAGINAAADAIQAFEVKQNLKQKIGVTFETGDVDGAIAQVQDDLDDRLSKDKVMEILLQVDATGALADLDKFGALAAVVQGSADAFGANWEASFTGIAEAIEGGNGAYLEQVGAIGSADGALVAYAKSTGKNVSQLTELEKQQALYNAVVEKLGPLTSDAATGVDHLRESNEQIKAALSDASTAFGEWVTALLDPNASSMADWWAGKIDTLTGIFRTFEEELNRSASESRVSVKLNPQDSANFDALRTERSRVEGRLGSERANLANAEGRGDQAAVKQIEANLDQLEARLEQLNGAIKQAASNAEAGIPISPVVSGNQADQATLDNLEAQRAAIIAQIKTTRDQMVDASLGKNNDEYYQLVANLDELEARLQTVTAATEKARNNAVQGLPIEPLAPTPASGEVLKIQATYAADLAREQQALTLSTLALKQAQEEISAEDFAAAFNAGDTATVDTSAASIANATAMQAEAQARLNLLKAEQSYLIAVEQLKAAEAGGDARVIARAAANLSAAATTLEYAQQSAVAAIQLDAYSESVKRVGNSFDEAKAAASAAGANFVPVDQWTAAIEAFRAGLTGNPLVVPTVLGPPTQAEQAATVPQGNADATRFDDESAFAASTAATTEAVQLAVVASNALLAARGALAAATREEKAAQDDLVAAQALGNASQQQSAQTAIQVANTKKVSAQAGIQAALAEYEAAKAALISAAALTTNAQANDDSAAANAKNAAATDQNADALLRTSQVAGMAVDAVSGLPVAFNSAELNAKQLEAALVDLEIQLMNIESAAANVGFSIAQRLVPSMGITGALQQGTEWAGQARQVREAVEAKNELLMSNGQDPLGKEYLDFAMGALTDNWQAYATDATAAMDTVGGAGKDHAKEMEQVADQINDALDGMVRGVLKDSTSGLIDLDALLPRVDTVDENARRMADVAVKGFQSPWYEGLKAMFAPEVFAGGEAAVKTAAANMVREHQKGLTTMLYDADAAAQQVFEQIQAKQRTDEFVAEIREKVKAMGADVEGFDIKSALGIELNDDDVAAKAGGAARKSAMSQVVAFEDLLAQINAVGTESASPVVGLLEPKEADNEKIAATGKDAIVKVGDAMVAQATEGKYGEKSITAIVTQLKTQEVQLKQSGVVLADWLGGSMVSRFESNVPSGLLDILVTNLIPLMEAQAASNVERQSNTTAN